MNKPTGVKFGQVVTVNAFLTRISQYTDDRGVLKIWYRQELNKPERCVVIAPSITLSDGERAHDYEAGFSYKPKTYFKAVKVGRRSGGVRYALHEDAITDQLPFKGESIT